MEWRPCGKPCHGYFIIRQSKLCIYRTTPQLEPSQDPRRHVMGGASHGGLLPHPPPHLPPPHPGAPPHMIMSQPPHNYGPARRPPLFHPRPPGGSGGMY
ncbi:hypothetical protein GBAR_LOCUS5648 [Geodia barretti]|uniref:Uncharacterized protein n=1 Tax=Geodia barretti TaxID=519541 RepID=A0AA35RC39_GEOBA|nr:hypothetical protein GBAR_LOCUS5648 [Geodia barretti]